MMNYNSFKTDYLDAAAAAFLLILLMVCVSEDVS